MHQPRATRPIPGSAAGHADRLLPLVRGVRARRPRRPGPPRRGGRLPRAVDLRPLPPVERRAGPQRRSCGRSSARSRRPRACRSRPASPARPCASTRRSSPRPPRRAPCCSRGASTSASAAARRSTSTSSATAGPRPTCAWRCSRRPSRSSARCGRAASAATAGATTPSRTRASTTCPTSRRRSSSPGFGPKAIELAARIGDGFCTTSPDKEAIDLYRSEGGTGPVHAGTKVCFMADEDEARATAHRLWPNEALPGELAQVLPTPAHFEQACELVEPEMLVTPVGPDIDAARRVAAPVRRRGRRRALRPADRPRAGRVLRHVGARGPAALRLTLARNRRFDRRAIR